MSSFGSAEEDFVSLMRWKSGDLTEEDVADIIDKLNPNAACNFTDDFGRPTVRNFVLNLHF